MIKPTIGRQVWYQHGGARLGDMTMRVPADYDKGETQPMAATVIHVLGDRTVSLDVIDHAGKHFPMIHIALLQDDDPVPDYPHARWMPYQVGQAKVGQAVV